MQLSSAFNVAYLTCTLYAIVFLCTFTIITTPAIAKPSRPHHTRSPASSISTGSMTWRSLQHPGVLAQDDDAAMMHPHQKRALPPETVEKSMLGYWRSSADLRMALDQVERNTRELDRPGLRPPDLMAWRNLVTAHAPFREQRPADLERTRVRVSKYVAELRAEGRRDEARRLDWAFADYYCVRLRIGRAARRFESRVKQLSRSSDAQRNTGRGYTKPYRVRGGVAREGASNTGGSDRDKGRSSGGKDSPTERKRSRSPPTPGLAPKHSGN